MDKENKLECLELLTWCALVALKLEDQDKAKLSKMTEHLFLMKWLSVAKKRKLFPKIVASDLDWLLNEGRRKGINANLKFKIEYLKSTCHKDVKAQSLLFRFTHAIETLKEMGWGSYLLASDKWEALSDGVLDSMDSYIFMEEAKLQNCFGTNGELINSFRLRVCGNVDVVRSVFETNKVGTEYQLDASGEQHFLCLIPE
ncbi:DUF2913 family protein [Salmonella enterica]|nr:DUF2913 family protein [Salmonella enterica]EGI8908756.1 DUF2913 family protein [Salmonella enterica]